MKLTRIISIALLCASLQVKAQGYQPKPANLTTRWTSQVSPTNALKEYPRPQLQRMQWTNLNGLWDYAIVGKEAVAPSKFDGKILVPYPLESALSGVKKSLAADQALWYRRDLNIATKSGRTILNFGAVDCEATIFVNGKEAGSHKGGYTNFSLDITSLLKTGKNELLVKVLDPTDLGLWPHGKQVRNPENIYYTPTSGIWQTVWLEQVPDNYIQRLTIVPDIDKRQAVVTVHATAESPVSITLGGATVKGKANEPITVPVKDMKLWSPADPYLYDLNIQLGTDKVKSYLGMRKVSIVKDENGFDRIALNNKPYFNLGTLDQGFWPDGLYTAATDEALKYDIEVIKAMGFNTIRKHIKIEPARWYYWADKLGMLVWQDFVNPNQRLPEGSKKAFEQQGAEMLTQLQNAPSIVTWVLFNEKWGQFDQERLTSWVKQTDPTRIVNGHSGEYLYVNNQLRSPSPNAYINADMTDVHAYPDPMNSLQMDGKARVCGEFGGIGVFVADHQWNPDYAWGYVQEKPADLKNKYAGMVTALEKFEKEGLSGSIYTQPFDVEGEQNGLMTYDREIVKIPFEQLRKIHAGLNPDVEKNVRPVTAANMDLTDPAVLAQQSITAFKAGSRDAKVLQAVVRRAGSVKDEVFQLMIKNEADFRKVMGSAKYSEFMSGKIFNESIQPLFAEQKTWQQIGEKMMQDYGPIGEETYLKIRSIGAYNEQDWKEFVPVAKEYIQKFGSVMNPKEKDRYTKLIAEHEKDIN